MKPLCVYHGGCQDGFAAAWAVREALGDEQVEFYPGVYQKAPPDVTGRDVILVDFSYKRPVIDQMAKAARTLLILDHHESAKNDLAGLATPSPWGEHVDLRGPYGAAPAALFDMERSGAGLTWDYFHPFKPRPAIINAIEDRDLWRFARGGSKETSESLFSYPYSFAVWDEIIARTESDPTALVVMHHEGSGILRKKLQDIRNLLPVVQRRMTIGGHDVPVANLPIVFTSDAGHIMCEGEAFAACYWDTATGRVFSLRSRHTKGHGLDVSKVASLYGGGGHKDAAGFEVSWDVAAKLGLAS